MFTLIFFQMMLSQLALAQDFHLAPLLAPCKIDGKESESIKAYQDQKTKTFYFEVSTLFKNLSEFVAEPVLEKINENEVPCLKEKCISEKNLFSNGISSIFNQKDIEVSFVTNPEVRKANIVYLSSQGVSPQFPRYELPSNFSAFANLRATQDFAFNTASVSSGRRPTRAQAESAIQIFSTVLEGEGNFTEADKKAPLNQTDRRFIRGDVRAVHDFTSPMIRFSAGDLNFDAPAMSRSIPMGGIGINSNFSLQPYKLTLPASQTEIFLKRPSRVVVKANGVIIQSISLPAGLHDLRNIAAQNGTNDIQIDITDDQGKKETQNITWVSNSLLLAKGLHQVGYNFGLPTINEFGLRKYDEKHFTTSLSHRVGVSSQFTLGAFTQFENRFRTMGIETLFATVFGTIGLEPVISQLGNNHIAGAGRVTYLWADFNGPYKSQRSFGLNVTAKEPEFTQLGQLVALNQAATEIAATYGQGIFWEMNFRVNAYYTFLRNLTAIQANTYGESFSLVKGWKNGVQIQVTFNDRHNIDQTFERGVFALISWAIPDSFHYVSASADTVRDSQRVDWRYTSPQLVNGVSAGLSAERNPDDQNANALLGYIGNRGTLNVDHNATKNLLTNKITQITSVSLGTSLAFAGGKFAIGRPILDSFAIVSPDKGLSTKRIDINPNSSRYYEAKSDWAGPALVPQLRSYQYYHLYLDPSHLDPGVELDQENYVLLPRYRSGFRIDAGTGARTLLSAILVDDTDTPIALASGEAVRINTEKGQNITNTLFFTSKRGSLSAEGFSPGTYELRLYTEGYETTKITIPESATGIYKLGKIKLNRLNSKKGTLNE